MGVIGLGQTQVKRGDRKEFKLLDLKHSVRIRHGSQTHAKRHSNGKHFNGPQVPLRKSPAASNNSLGKTLYPSVMLNPQCNTLGPGTAIGFAGEDQWCFLGGSHIPQFANTSEQSGLLVNRSLPRSVAVGSTSLFDGLAAKSSWSWFAEDFLGARSYQDPQEPWSSYPYLEPSFPEMKYSR